MANLQRGIKAFGTRKFATERAAAPGNKAPILSAEIDYDLDNIYNAWNTGANITPGSVGLSQLAPNSVDSTKIIDGSITLADMGPDSVDSSKIVDGSIATSDLKDGNVTKEKLAPGAAIWDLGHHNRSGDILNMGYTGGDQLGYLFVGPTTTQVKSHGVGLGAYLTVRIYLMGTAVIGVGPGSTVHARLVRDSTVTVFDAYGFAQAWATSSPQELPWTIYYEAVIGTPDANEHSYRVDVFKLPGVSDQGSLRAGTLAMIAYS